MNFDNVIRFLACRFHVAIGKPRSLLSLLDPAGGRDADGAVIPGANPNPLTAAGPRLQRHGIRAYVATHTPLNVAVEILPAR